MYILPLFDLPCKQAVLMVVTFVEEQNNLVKGLHQIGVVVAVLLHLDDEVQLRPPVRRQRLQQQKQQ